MNFQPADVAKECGVSVNTIRQWCKDYGEFLTPGAQVEDAPRILTERDMEVLKYVSELRKERLRRPQIVLRLRETKFGTIEPAPATLQPSRTMQASPQEGPGQAIAPSPIGLDLETLTAAFLPFQRQIDELRTQQRNVWVAFAAGIVVSAVFFLIIVLLLKAG